MSWWRWRNDPRRLDPPTVPDATDRGNQPTDVYISMGDESMDREQLIDNMTYSQTKQLATMLRTIKREMWRDLMQGGDGMEGDRIVSRLIDQIDEELNRDELLHSDSGGAGT